MVEKAYACADFAVAGSIYFYGKLDIGFVGLPVDFSLSLGRRAGLGNDFATPEQGKWSFSQ